MRLMSEDFEGNGFIPSQFTCDGENVSPELHWDEAPEKTESFALSVTDPDAPGGTFVHWLVYNVAKDVARVERGGGLPANARQVRNDFGREEYCGPCPPSGTHRYYFRLYALDTDSLGRITKTDFLRIVDKHMMAKAELMGRYRRS